jgi:anti-sigma-K factor RskA
MTLELENHVLDLLPAYVVDALTDEETSQVAEHVAGCQTCQAELTRLQQVADELPLALVQTTPPSRVKDSLMSAIHSRHVDAEPAKQPTAWQKLTGFLRMPLPALGLALIVLLALGNILLLRQLTLSSRQTTTPMQIVALANTQNAPGAMATLIIDQQGDYGTLVVDKLAALEASQQYQIWLIKGGQRVSGGLFSVNPDGYASLEIMAAKPLAQYDSVGITVEPLGGSPGPTGPKVLGGVIPH